MTTLTRFLRATIPDPFVVALLLSLFALGLAALLGSGGLFGALEAWVPGKSGMWSLLTFSMQMCLILVTGFVVARTRAVRAGIAAVADRLGSAAQGALAIAWVAMGLGLIHWGLGLVVGALLAREVGDRLQARGLHPRRPLLAAAGYTGLCVWHGGLSGSAPIKLTRDEDVVEILGEGFLETHGVIDLGQTVLSVENMVVNAALLVVVPATLYALSRSVEPLSTSEDPATKETRVSETPIPPGLAGWLDRTPWVTGAVGLLLLLWGARWAVTEGISSLDPNTLNAMFLGLGLVLAGSARAFVQEARAAAAACAGIIIQFPLYAGIRGLLLHAGLVDALAAAMPASETGLALTALGSAGLVNLFVPSGGGQWSVQGPILMEAALSTGADPARIVRAFAYGNQWTNLVQPFWALPLLGITGTRASDVLSYTMVLAGVTGVVFALGVVL